MLNVLPGVAAIIISALVLHELWQFPVGLNAVIYSFQGVC